MNLYADLFLTFAKVGVCTFGGGYAMLPILQREVVEKKNWATEEELTDYFTATFIGQKYAGNLGGTIATLGVVFPSLIIITSIAAVLTNFAEIPVVQHALAGINAAVVALIAVSVIKLGKSTLKNAPAVCIFLAVLVLSELGRFLGLPADTPAGQVLDVLASPVTLVVLAGVTGVLLAQLSGSRKGGEGK